MISERHRWAERTTEVWLLSLWPWTSSLRPQHSPAHKFCVLVNSLFLHHSIYTCLEPQCDSGSGCSSTQFPSTTQIGQEGLGYWVYRSHLSQSSGSSSVTKFICSECWRNIVKMLNYIPPWCTLPSGFLIGIGGKELFGVCLICLRASWEWLYLWTIA